MPSPTKTLRRTGGSLLASALLLAGCHDLNSAAPPAVQRAASPPAARIDTAPPTATQILDEAVAAVGGRSALESVQEESAQYDAVVTGADGMATPAVLTERVRRDAARVDLAVNGSTFSVVCHGTHAVLVAGTHDLPLSGTMADEALRAGYGAPLELLRRWVEGRTTARLLPAHGYGTSVLDVVALDDPEVGHVQVEIDRATHLPAALFFADDLAHERVELDDWAGEGALLVPHRRVAFRVQAGGTQRIDARLTSFAFNQSISTWELAAQ